MSEEAAGLVVVQAGLSTTLQDRGRVGWQRFGVPVSGALDRVALAAANVVAGNPPEEAGLECLYRGSEMEVAGETVRVAVSGAGATLEILDASGGLIERVDGLESRTVPAGQRVRVRIVGPSISAYLAVEGGFAVAPVLGSRSTYVRAALGGFEGRALREGDRLPLTRKAASSRGERRLNGVSLLPPARARVIAGPQEERFEKEAMQALTSRVYTVRAASDRMGLRLDGPKLAHTHGADIVSDGIAPGAIQVPGDGLPIIMLADRQTTGGYTKIATVASADIPALGRVGPGARLTFEIVTVEEAETLARALEAEIAAWPDKLAAVGARGDELARLLSSNLISGVTDGTCGR